MSTTLETSKEPHPSFSSCVPPKNVSNFAFASQYFDETCGWKGQGLGKFEHDIVEPIFVEPCLPFDIIKRNI